MLNHQHIKEWELTGQRPPCKYHLHTSYDKAMNAVKADNAFFVVELRAVVFYSSVLTYVWQGKRSGGFSCMQLCPIQGRKPPTQLCESARKA